uniref:RING-type domain-containing protein n=1 Tax=Arcella intermedia TaxID=1963864 RepID=A0A6B2LFU9_9EUKA
MFSIYFFGVSSSISVILVIEKNSRCDQPLYLWAIMQLAILVASWIVRVWNSLNQYNGINMDNASIWLRLQSRIALFLQRLMNMFWCVWFLIGMVWTFKSETCHETSPPLYILSLTLIIINLFLIGICVLCCLCAFLCFGFIYMINPSALDQNANRGASKQHIQKLETKVFQKGLFEEEDAKCAICLSNYEVGEDIKFLPCTPKNHHYHTPCVDEWLQINKNCPFCKRPIDLNEPETQQPEGPDNV